MAKQVTLTKGLSYTYGKQKFVKGVSQSVDGDTASYLEGTGHFSVTSAKGTKKVKIRKPDTKKVTKPANKEDAPDGIPPFRSKKELADYAEKEHGLKFEGDPKGLKMDAMREKLSAHIEANNPAGSNEPKIEV